MDRSPEVDAYIATLPAARQADMQKLRGLLHEAIAGVSERMAYKMPAFVTTDLVCCIAAQKRHFSIYICDPDLLDRFRAQLAGLDLGKGCIRFKRFEQLPRAALCELLQAAAAAPGWQH